MVTEKELDEAIADLENQKASLSCCSKLADLYTVREHMIGRRARTSEYADRLEISGDSDFLRAVSGKESRQAWAVMDELMDTLRVVNPRVYDSVMRKIMKL